MRIGVLSDTHENEHATYQVLSKLRAEGIDTVIHCGDMTSGHLADLFSDFTLHHVQGNNDLDMFSIGIAVQSCRPGSTSDRYFTGKIGGTMIAALHGHNHILFDSFLKSRKYRYIFTGHTHRQNHTVYEGGFEGIDPQGLSVTGDVHVINPGAVGGVYRGPRGFCVVDLSTDDVTFHQI